MPANSPQITALLLHLGAEISATGGEFSASLVNIHVANGNENCTMPQLEGGKTMKILIATDGSDYSREAVEECCKALIRSAGTEILIVSSYEDAYPIMAEPFALSAGYYDKLTNTMTEMSKAFLDEAAAIIRRSFPTGEVPVETEILHGAPDQQIIEKARAWNADVIVVGSHGRGFWGRILGSVSTAVVQHAPCSVLVVRKKR